MALVATFAALSANAQITPVPGTLTQNPVTGHYYQAFAANGITWDAAQTYMQDNLPSLGTDGLPSTGMDAVAPHLATITSFDEDEFIESLRAGELSPAGPLTRFEVWVGGKQPAGSATGADWAWVNGEGTISTMQVTLPSYSNWLSGEPNDAGGGESFLAVGLGNQFGWNDEGNLGLIGGFIVEWDVPLPAVDCVATSENPLGCTTIVGQTLSFPEGSVPAGATISFNSFEFLDPRVDNVSSSPDFGKCVLREPLKIFGTTGIGSAPGERPEMSIPPYLCGSPKFVVVAVDSGDLIIETGTVGVENDTAIVLPDNVYPDGGMSVCEPTITQVQYTDGDPQYQDVSTWQDTLTPTKMLEVDPGVGGVGVYEGATGEFTDECGSSRMRVRGASYFGIGFHIDFGPGFEWAGNSAGNFDSFVALTRYKLTLLQQSLENAKTVALGNGDYNKMKQQLKNAVKKLDQGNYSSSLGHVNKFLKFVNAANYTIVPDENFNGEHVMRGSNVAFMLRVKIIPYAP